MYCMYRCAKQLQWLTGSETAATCYPWPFSSPLELWRRWEGGQAFYNRRWGLWGRWGNGILIVSHSDSWLLLKLIALPDPLCESDMKGEITEHANRYSPCICDENKLAHTQPKHWNLFLQCPKNIGAVRIIRICCCKDSSIDEICFFICFVLSFFDSSNRI